jgi:hypothetical protein
MEAHPYRQNNGHSKCEWFWSMQWGLPRYNQSGHKQRGSEHLRCTTVRNSCERLGKWKLRGNRWIARSRNKRDNRRGYRLFLSRLFCRTYHGGSFLNRWIYLWKFRRRKLELRRRLHRCIGRLGYIRRIGCHIERRACASGIRDKPLLPWPCDYCGRRPSNSRPWCVTQHGLIQDRRK